MCLEEWDEEDKRKEGPLGEWSPRSPQEGGQEVG